jgi:hypothetical protein
MKTFAKLAAAVALLGITSAAHAAKIPADYSEYPGVYKGTLTFAATGSFSVTGPVTIVVKATKDGSSAQFSILGSTSVQGTPFTLSNVLKLLAFNTFTASDITFSTLTSGISAVGTQSVGRRKFSFSAPFTVDSTTGTLSGNGSLKVGKTSQTLLLNAALSVNGSGVAYTYSFVVKKKLKKSN